MTTATEKKMPDWTFGDTPMFLIENACKKKPLEQEVIIFGQNLGKDIKLGICPDYECKIEIRKGEKARAHYCHGNYHTCDHIMGIALQLSDESSPLYKKVFGK